MKRERIHYMGSQPLNGNDAYAILGTLFDWIEELESQGNPLPKDLLDRLRQLGYCICTTEFGCASCGGRNDTQTGVKK